ncbi:LysM peptidoglycan-binding domain-containing protein [Mucilaginibacter sp. Bleaf8]|uniref:DPBB and LysM peptidoglycan-binding domain-containing protein n=1 Tax=Mucilaginibacter sp. Bleaf8 TaxID=2834430 RepID=UPI001BCBE380|nr:LysM peptidoglycan-binding domain-containing protein [Mucilaginibacter sp. Bleaf8]MBS7562974.1 LysM peptidoglycan-binding domain-containing protein [Mucilaginibacter sp. Bleaf8]
MKLKNLLFAVPLCVISTSVLANSLTDSIGIENQDGKKVILHKLEPKDNYYAIGRRYNVAPNVIIQFNNNASLRVGQIIKVPTNQPFVSAAPQAVNTSITPSARNQNNNSIAGNQPAQNNDNTVTEYKVSAGETLYAISRRFNVRVEEIMSFNNLRSSSLSPGQIIKIRSAAPAAQQQNPVQQPAATPTPVQANMPPVSSPEIPSSKRDSTTVDSDSASVARRLPANRYGLTERNENGVATFMDEAGLDPNKKLVLHRTAPVGTVIKITNPMTNRTTFAKVVGRFTENEMTKDVVIVMTKNTADALGALDKRFRVTISYGVSNE